MILIECEQPYHDQTPYLQMDKVPDCSVPSDESTDEIDTMSEMAPQRPKRSCHHPVSLIFLCFVT